jgi:hypothetical protein
MLVGPLAEGLAEAARASVKTATRTKAKRRPRIARGATIRPGSLTPLWNELAKTARQLMQRRGEKANLARFLAVPRQRVHQYVTEQSASPDAERTLLLLAWVHARQAGRTVPLPIATYRKR